MDASSEVKINVNNNNLYVLSNLKKDPHGKVLIFYKEVIESVNAMINWDDVSHEKPIAEISFINDDLYMTWKGFFDVKKNIYVWGKEPDFVVQAGSNANIKMNKCNF